MRVRIVYIVLAVFLTNYFVPPSCAQMLMSKPGERVELSPAFHPSIFKGVKVDASDPLHLDFILDPGDDLAVRPEVTGRLVKYFLAALTIPNKDLWVNLSPYEKERIVPDAFGQTEMGRDLLAQDYFLKQLTASLVHPENELGREFWAKIYRQAQEQFGAVDIPVDTFNKVWIVPSKAVVYEDGALVYVTESRLKVMLDADHLAAMRADTASSQNEVSRQVMREIVIPVLEKEVNEGRSFAQVRQAYNSLILALWYKKKILSGVLAASYVDRDKVRGVHIDDPAEARKIWGQYVEAFKKGAFNFIKEERDEYSQELIPRKYFSGGLGFDKAEQVLDMSADRDDIVSRPGDEVVSVRLKPETTVTPKTTWSGRKAVLAEFLFSGRFGALTGLELREGKHLIHDIGVGNPPVTTIEFNRFCKGMNSGINVIGSELQVATARYQIDLYQGDTFEELKRMIIVKNPDLRGKTIKAVSFLVTDAGDGGFAGVSEVFISIDDHMDGIPSVYSIPVAVAPYFDYQNRQTKLRFDDPRRDGMLFLRIMDHFGVGKVRSLIEVLPPGEVAASINNGEMVIRKEPLRTALGREGIDFFESDGRTPSVRDVDVAVASHVVMHLTDEQRVPFFNVVLEELRDRGVFIVENSAILGKRTVEQVDIYQKVGGKLNYGGSFVYDMRTRALLSAEELREYKEGIEPAMAGYPLVDGVRFLFDAAEISGADLQSTVQAQVKEVSRQDVVPFILTPEDVAVLKRSKHYLKGGTVPEKELWEKLLVLSRQMKAGVPIKIDLSHIPNDAPSAAIVESLLLELYRAMDEVFVGFKRYTEDFSKVTFSIKELIKNAIIHGNKTDLKQPFYVWLKYGALPGGMNTIYVIDMGVVGKGAGLVEAYNKLGLTGKTEGVVTMNGFGSYTRGNLSFKGEVLPAQYSAAIVIDSAQAHDPSGPTSTGGIDLQSLENIFEYNGQGMPLHMTPGVGAVEQGYIQGYSPVIIGVRPLKDLPQFFGEGLPLGR